MILNNKTFQIIAVFNMLVLGYHVEANAFGKSKKQTIVSIKGDQFYINEKPTFPCYKK